MVRNRSACNHLQSSVSPDLETPEFPFKTDDVSKYITQNKRVSREKKIPDSENSDEEKTRRKNREEMLTFTSFLLFIVNSFS